MKLTAKQERFCHEYLVDMNGTQAAIRSGYSKKTAREQGSTLLTKINIQTRIKKLSAPVINKLEISKERLLTEFARIGFSDIRAFFNEDGELKKISELDDDSAAALSSIESDELFDGMGKDKRQIGYTKKIKLWDKIGALTAIAKLMDYNPKEKIEHSGGVDFGMFLSGKRKET